MLFLKDFDPSDAKIFSVRALRARAGAYGARPTGAGVRALLDSFSRLACGPRLDFISLALFPCPFLRISSFSLPFICRVYFMPLALRPLSARYARTVSCHVSYVRSFRVRRA
jgi:hypothetical protein